MLQHSKNLAVYIKDLTVAYKEKPVIWDLDLSIPIGTLLAIVGPNGSGKTTLLKSILGLISPATGVISILGSKEIAYRKKIAYIPQKATIDWTFPITVFDVVLMGRYGSLNVGQRPTSRDHELATEALDKVNMLKSKDQQINNLSGGQQQRVFLARALVQDAEIYLMDEPFVGVDILTEKMLLKLFKTLQKQNKTVIVVHHDLFTVKKYFDWVFFMNTKHIALGPIETTMTKENIAQTFVCSTSHLPTIVSELF